MNIPLSYKKQYQCRFWYTKPQPVATETETDYWSAACLHLSEQLPRCNQALIVIHVVVLRLVLIMIPANGLI